MKKIFFLLAAMAMTFGAKAQIVESSAKTIKVEAAKPKSGYNRIMFNYAPVFTSHKLGGEKYETEGGTIQGGEMTYVHGFRVSKKLPMYIETGLGYQIGGATKFTLMRASVPVLFTYRFGFGEAKKIKISPFAGFNFGFNVMTDDDAMHQSWKGDGWLNDKNYNVFQMGMMFGANFTFNRFNLQVGYCVDFMPLYKQEEGYTEVYYYRYDVTAPSPEYIINSGKLFVGVGFEF